MNWTHSWMFDKYAIVLLGTVHRLCYQGRGQFKDYKILHIWLAKILQYDPKQLHDSWTSLCLTQRFGTSRRTKWLRIIKFVKQYHKMNRFIAGTFFFGQNNSMHQKRYFKHIALNIAKLKNTTVSSFIIFQTACTT